MTQVRIIGDVHGKWTQYRHIAEGADKSIQVGDFGIGFCGRLQHENMVRWFEDHGGTHRFIRGNHDNPAMCKVEMPGYIYDTKVEGDTMFIGGAWSIDHALRTEGHDWWRDEELSYDELQDAIEVYDTFKPRVMITHDCPAEVSKKLFVDTGKSLAFGGIAHKTRTGQALQAMWEIHQPELWVYGHWHNSVTETMNGTKFVCIDELDYIDVDLNLT